MIRTTFNPLVSHTFKGPQTLVYDEQPGTNTPYRFGQQLGWNSDINISARDPFAIAGNGGSSEKLTLNLYGFNLNGSMITKEFTVKTGIIADVNQTINAMIASQDSAFLGNTDGENLQINSFIASRSALSGVFNGGVVVLTEAIGHEIAAPSFAAGPTITSLYGLKIGNIVGGTSNYSIFTGTGRVRFGDDFLIEKSLSNLSETINGSAGFSKSLKFQTGSLNRWEISSTAAAETGLDAGSLFSVTAYTDAGVAIDSPIVITRAAGNPITIGGGSNRPVLMTGPLNLPVYTVAGLPAGTVGKKALVSNALAPAFGVAVAGGGAVTVPVFYNGAAWIVG